LAFFEKALEAKVMSTHLLIRANVSKAILHQAHKIATDFESRYSAYKENSFLNSINNNAGIISIPCTPEDYALFNASIKASQQTDGLFDITIGALSHGAYHFGFVNEGKASQTQIETQKKLVNYQTITLSQKSIYLKYKGMRLDLGGIGKGYAAKRIAHFLANNGATKILVDVGGEIVTRGKAYTIALKDPFNEGNIAYIKTSKADIAISTSGTYERFIDEENHHILNTDKGTSPHYYTSMTILQNGWNIDYLDAYATALFNQPPENIRQMADTLDIAMITIDNHTLTSLYQTQKLDLSSIAFINS
jgi:thiamine biosynthesis lipoprotein